MKIKKFNENTNNNIWICLIKSYSSAECESTTAFKTAEDMENWLLNFINSELRQVFKDNPDMTKDIKEDDWIGGITTNPRPDGVELNQKNEPVFTNVVEAINWYQETFDSYVEYEQSEVFSNVKLKYGVEIIKQTKKYNL